MAKHFCDLSLFPVADLACSFSPAHPCSCSPSSIPHGCCLLVAVLSVEPCLPLVDGTLLPPTRACCSHDPVAVPQPPGTSPTHSPCSLPMHTPSPCLPAKYAAGLAPVLSCSVFVELCNPALLSYLLPACPNPFATSSRALLPHRTSASLPPACSHTDTFGHTHAKARSYAALSAIK